MRGERYWGETDRANAGFFRWMDVGTALFVASVVFIPVPATRVLAMWLSLGWFLVLISVARYRGRDEWAELCWRRATAAAATVFVAAPVLGLGVMALYGRITDGRGAVDTPAATQLAVFNIAWIAGVASLFAVFQWTRFRGRA